jgi:biopolymer transport protein TolR
MRGRPVGRFEPITKINVTPIIDVALVLVIILLVTAPLLSVADLPVDLPVARTREAEDERNVSITMAANGGLAIDDRRVERSTLVSALRTRLESPENTHVLVVVRADSGIPYAEVQGVLEEARAAGAKRLGLATRQKMENPR